MWPSVKLWVTLRNQFSVVYPCHQFLQYVIKNAENENFNQRLEWDPNAGWNIQHRLIGNIYTFGLYTLGIFLDNQGAFGNITIESI